MNQVNKVTTNSRYMRSSIAYFMCIVILFLCSCESNGKIVCKDKFTECLEHTDDCSTNPGFMVLNCPRTCNFCHLRDPKVRCNVQFLNISTEAAFKPGDMETMFKRMSNKHNIKALSQDPWILEVSNFLTDKEVDDILDSVTKWDQSKESGEIDSSGEGKAIITAARTSSTFWCNLDCEKSSPSEQIRHKIVDLLQIPKIHYEPIQLLRYTEGQRFVPHHDFSFQELSLPCGPRVLTFFLYLSDVEEGGNTYFPDLGVSIEPKRGKAVLWANTLSRNPLAKDIRMTHEAQVVKVGVKYAANVWVHVYEWEKTSLWACTGS